MIASMPSLRASARRTLARRVFKPWVEALEDRTVLSPTSTLLSSSVNPAVWGQPVSFTASVISGTPGTPTGSMTFMDGTTTLGSAQLDSSAQAVLTTSSLAVASHAITAIYSGDSQFDPSTSGPLSELVNRAATQTNVNTFTSAVQFGRPVILTAAVTAVAPGAGIPTGFIAFADGGTPLGTAALNAAGHAIFTMALPQVGQHVITAGYNGDPDFSLSGSSTSFLVFADSTTATVTADDNPSTVGQAVTFTATLSNTSVPGGPAPSGTVTFMDGDNQLGTATLDSTGSATFATFALAAGDHSITVSYSGNASFFGSTSDAYTQTVNQGTSLDSQTSLSSSSTSSVFGQSVSFAAFVSPAASGAPTGTVTFWDGSTPLATVGLTSGKATFTTSSFSVGIHTVTAVYSGDGLFGASTSAMLDQVVGKAAAGIVLNSSRNPLSRGSSFVLTASVSVKTPGAGTPTGTVTFMDGDRILGTVALDSQGHASLKVIGLSPGDHAITAVYSGNDNLAGATSGVFMEKVAKHHRQIRQDRDDDDRRDEHTAAWPRINSRDPHKACVDCIFGSHDW
jgi:hypothetical protein